MTVVDYTLLHERVPHLQLEESAGGFYCATDERGRLFLPPSRNMDAVIRFMRLLAIRGDVTLDEESITWFRALREFGEFSVRAGSLSEREAPFEPDSRSESDRKSEGGTKGGAGRNVPVPLAGPRLEPASPLSEIGAASPPPVPAAPVRLRLVN